jgi:hypothetical protein
MTTLQISSRGTHRSVAEIVVAQTAFAMLRWSTRRAQHQPAVVGLTHEQLQFRRRYELERAQVPAGSGLLR